MRSPGLRSAVHRIGIKKEVFYMNKNYHLELIRMISFLMVIIIHITNYFCRAYGEIPTDQYVFSLILDTVSRVSVPCFFMTPGSLLLGREESLHKHFTG